MFHKEHPSTQEKHKTNLGNSSGGQCHNLRWCISPQSGDLGQGGCMALEDAIILAKKLQ
jgi:hypothetical protein